MFDYPVPHWQLCCIHCKHKMFYHFFGDFDVKKCRKKSIFTRYAVAVVNSQNNRHHHHHRHVWLVLVLILFDLESLT